MVESFCRALLMSVGLVQFKFGMRNFLHFLLAFYLMSPLVDASVAMQDNCPLCTSSGQSRILLKAA